MRNIDFQIVHSQTPGVERSYQTRRQQGELDQRVFANHLKDTVDEKIRQAQSSEQTEKSDIRLQREKEKQQNKSKKQSKESEKDAEQNSEEQGRSRTGTSNRGGKIDIVV